MCVKMYVSLGTGGSIMRKEYQLLAAWEPRDYFNKICNGNFDLFLEGVFKNKKIALKEFNYAKKHHKYANQGEILVLKLYKVYINDDDEVVDEECIDCGYYYCFKDRELREITPEEFYKERINLFR